MWIILFVIFDQPEEVVSQGRFKAPFEKLLAQFYKEGNNHIQDEKKVERIGIAEVEHYEFLHVATWRQHSVIEIAQEIKRYQSQCQDKEKNENPSDFICPDNNHNNSGQNKSRVNTETRHPEISCVSLFMEDGCSSVCAVPYQAKYQRHY